MKKALYLDDVRTPIETIPEYDEWIIVRSYNEFVQYITDNGMPDLISYDHDLADEHMDDYYEQFRKFGRQLPAYDLYKEKTGLDCAKYVCELHQDNPDMNFPRSLVHSFNPVGTSNIVGYINGYIKHAKLDSFCYEQITKFES